MQLSQLLTDDRGTLEPGKRADLIVLAANPLEALLYPLAIRHH